MADSLEPVNKPTLKLKRKPEIAGLAEGDVAWRKLIFLDRKGKGEGIMECATVQVMGENSVVVWDRADELVGAASRRGAVTSKSDRFDALHDRLQKATPRDHAERPNWRVKHN